MRGKKQIAAAAETAAAETAAAETAAAETAAAETAAETARPASLNNNRRRLSTEVPDVSCLYQAEGYDCAVHGYVRVSSCLF